MLTVLAMVQCSERIAHTLSQKKLAFPPAYQVFVQEPLMRPTEANLSLIPFLFLNPAVPVDSTFRSMTGLIFTNYNPFYVPMRVKGV